MCGGGGGGRGKMMSLYTLRRGWGHGESSSGEERTCHLQCIAARLREHWTILVHSEASW